MLKWKYTQTSIFLYTNNYHIAMPAEMFSDVSNFNKDSRTKVQELCNKVMICLNNEESTSQSIITNQKKDE